MGACAAVGLALAAGASAAPVAFTVTLASDEPDATLADGICDVDLATPGQQCTLRAALQQADDASDANTIAFDILGGGVHRIAPLSALPDITQPATIDGYTQHGASVNTKGLAHGDNAALRIELNGRKLPTNTPVTGLTVGSGAGGTVIRGLVIDRFTTGILFKANTVITGNFVGTDPTGTKARGNTFDGIFGFGGTRTTVGGPLPADRNLISSNGDSGLTTNATVTVQGNLIGTASDGSSPLGNKFVFHLGAVELAGVGNIVGGAGNSANVIAFNADKGIALLNSGSPSTFSRNRIFANGGLAIDLGEDGRTPNDPGDTDTGPNDFQNFPVLASAKSSRHHTKVNGRLDSTPNTQFTVEVFTSPRHVHGAKRFLGSIPVTTDATGAGTINLTVRRIKQGSKVSATATSASGATSELSPSTKVKAR
ncbi:MAG: hypothetical protein ACRDMH_00015 [Solirubrobacterales bacterium]